MPAANSQHESNNWVGQREHTNKKSIQLSILSVNEIVYISWAGWSCPLFFFFIICYYCCCHSIHLFRFVRLRSMRANNGIQIDFLFLVLMAKQKNKKNCGQQSNYRYW